MQLLRNVGTMLLASLIMNSSAIASSPDLCPSKAFIWDHLQVVATSTGQEQMQVRTDSDTVYVNTTADDEKTLKAIFEFRKACNDSSHQYLCTCHIDQGTITPGNNCNYTDIKVKVVVHMLPENCADLLKRPCSQDSQDSKGCNFSLTETKPMEPLDPAMEPLNPAMEPLVPANPVLKPLPIRIQTPKFTPPARPGAGVLLGESQQPFFVFNDCAGGGSNRYCVNSELATQAFATTATDGTAWGGSRNNIEFDECKPGGGPDRACHLVNPVDELSLKHTATLLDNNQFEITYMNGDNIAFRIRSTDSYQCDVTEHGTREFELDNHGNIICQLKP